MQGNIKKAYILRAMQCSWLAIPTTLLFYKNVGLTLEHLFLLKSALSLAVLIFELPSGYFADVVGRKQSMLFSSLLWCASLFCFCIGDSFSYFLIGELLLGLAISLLSGADSALIFDTLKELKETHRYQKIEGHLSSIAGFSEAIGGLIGSWLASLALVYPYYAQLLIMITSVGLILSLREPPRKQAGLNEGNRLKELLSVCRYSLVEKRELRHILLLTALLGFASFIVVWHAQAYMNFIKLDVLYFGYAWAFFHLCMGVAALFSNALERLIGRFASYWFFMLIVLFSFIGLSLSSSLAGLGFIALCYIIRGLRTPIQRAHIHELTPSHIRASVFSVSSLVFRILFVCLSPLIGYIADFYTLQAALILTAALICIPTTALLCTYKVVFIKK